MSVANILNSYDGDAPTLCIAGGGGGGVSNILVGAGLTKTGTGATPQINLGFTASNQLLVGTGNNSGAVLPPGPNGYFLRVNLSGNLEYAPVATGGVVSVTALDNNVGYVDNTHTATPHIGLAFPATQGCIPSGNGVGVNQGAFTAPLTFPDNQNWVLTANNMAANGVGCNWAPAAGTVFTGEAPLVEFVDGTLSKIGIDFTANSVGQIPVGISSVGGKLGTLTPALTFPADEGKVLVARAAQAATGGYNLELNTAGSVQSVSAAPTNVIFVDNTAPTAPKVGVAFTAKGDLTVGTGANTGVILPVLPAEADDYVLTTASAEASGLKWKAQGSGSAPTINRSSNYAAATPILPPTSANDTMLLVADLIIPESWVNNAAWTSILPPFKSSTAGNYLLYPTTIQTGFPFPDNEAPGIGVNVNGVPKGWVAYLGGGTAPFADPVALSITEFGGYVWITGGFDTCGTFNNPPTPDTTLGPAGCIVRFDITTNDIILINDAVNISGVDKTGGNALVYTIISDRQLEEYCFFCGDFDVYSGTGGGGALKNISYYSLQANRFGNVVALNLGADGPVYTLYVGGDPPNYGPGSFYMGGNFTHVGFNTVLPIAYYAGYNIGGGGGGAYTTSSPAVLGPVNYIERSAVDDTQNIITGYIDATTAGNAGAAYVLRLTPYTKTPIVLPGGIAAADGGVGGVQSITSGDLVVAPPAVPTATFDIIITYPSGPGNVKSYRSQTLGTWVYNPALTGIISSNAGTHGVGGLKYEAGLLYCYTNSVEWKLLQITTASPLTIVFTLPPTNEFYANAGAYHTATMNERTSQYFIADAQAENWIAVGGLVGGLVFS